MKVLVIGSGGREHALCWALAASPLVERLYCAPGNAGIAADAECLAIDAMDFDGIVRACGEHRIDFVVVGPEGPLVAGLVDRLSAARIKAFGPRANAAALEGSKGFTKDLCAKYGIPTARYRRFTDASSAKAFARSMAPPIVVKADGLAAGKGVVIAASHAEADQAIDDILGGRFGAAGAELVVEEFLDGEEVSYFALSDGSDVLPLIAAQDHKRVGDGDTGPNTGGMGAYSPAPVFDAATERRTLDEIIRPTIKAMATEGRPFCGVLFAGLMITREGPKLIEYNVRFGDPECQVIVMRLFSDILPVLLATADGVLRHVDLRWRREAALVVVMAANGYPEQYRKGTPISGLDAAAKAGATVFHAGTMREQGALVANGGRVLNVAALGASIAEAKERAYRGVDAIRWPDGFCRRDIGWRAIARERAKP
ncbi:MAG: phosphoribosylamine--glycine ligase [Alphaproteobacteria bacterium]|nr:phosphoribosylamine--glycine ligase [Alphaproteobacteria bacterium]